MSATGQSYVQLADVPGWDPRSGDNITRRWRGLYASLLPLATELREKGIRYSGPERLDDGYYVLTAVIGASETQSPTEPLSDQWELLVNDLERSLWSRKNIQQALQEMPDARSQAVWRNFVNQFAQGNLKAEGLDGVEFDLTTSELINGAKRLGVKTAESLATLLAMLKEMALGVDSYIDSQMVLRRTRVLAANSIIKPNNDNRNKILTTEELKADESVPDAIRFDLPDGEWLIKGKPLTQVAADKWQIVDEWWWAELWLGFYDRVHPK